MGNAPAGSRLDDGKTTSSSSAGGACLVELRIRSQLGLPFNLLFENFSSAEGTSMTEVPRAFTGTTTLRLQGANPSGYAMYTSSISYRSSTPQQVPITTKRKVAGKLKSHATDLRDKRDEQILCVSVEACAAGIFLGSTMAFGAVYGNFTVADNISGEAKRVSTVQGGEAGLCKWEVSGDGSAANPFAVDLEVRKPEGSRKSALLAAFLEAASTNANVNANASASSDATARSRSPPQSQRANEDAGTPKESAAAAALRTAASASASAAASASASPPSSPPNRSASSELNTVTEKKNSDGGVLPAAAPAETAPAETAAAAAAAAAQESRLALNDDGEEPRTADTDLTEGEDAVQQSVSTAVATASSSSPSQRDQARSAEGQDRPSHGEQEDCPRPEEQDRVNLTSLPSSPSAIDHHVVAEFRPPAHAENLTGEQVQLAEEKKEEEEENEEEGEQLPSAEGDKAQDWADDEPARSSSCCSSRSLHATASADEAAPAAAKTATTITTAFATKLSSSSSSAAAAAPAAAAAAAAICCQRRSRAGQLAVQQLQRAAERKPDRERVRELRDKAFENRSNSEADLSVQPSAQSVDETGSQQRRKTASGQLAIKAAAAAEEASRQRQLAAEKKRQEEEAAARLKEEEAAAAAYERQEALLLRHAQDQEFHQSLLQDQLKDLHARAEVLRSSIAQTEHSVEEGSKSIRNAEQRMQRFGENPRLLKEKSRLEEELKSFQEELPPLQEELAEVDAAIRQKSEMLSAMLIDDDAD